MSILEEPWVKIQNWRKATLALVDLGYVWITEYDRRHSEYMSVSKGNLDFEIIESFLKSSEIELEQSEDRIEYVSKCLLKCTSVLEGLKKLGIVEKQEMKEIFFDPLNPNSGQVKNYMYRITTHGVDIALKLQEHDDNEKRHQDQIDINKALKRNSNITLIISIFALVVAGTLSLASWKNYQLQKNNLGTSANNFEYRIEQIEKVHSKALQRTSR